MLLVTLQVVSVVVVAVAMALALAHALEWPGKKRLSKEQYLATQAIYYPGFTLGGLAEPLGLALLLALLWLTPFGGAPFALTAGAFSALVLMHAAYWLLTHPVNGFWLKGFTLSKWGARFFALGGRGSRSYRVDPAAPGRMPEWTALRDRWERSHMVRAALGAISLALLAAAVAV